MFVSDIEIDEWGGGGKVSKIYKLNKIQDPNNKIRMPVRICLCMKCEFV